MLTVIVAGVARQGTEAGERRRELTRIGRAVLELAAARANLEGVEELPVDELGAGNVLVGRLQISSATRDSYA